MDAEIQAQLDQMMAFSGQHFNAIERRFDGLETKMRDGFLVVGDHLQRLDTWLGSLEARLGSLEARLDTLEERVTEGFLAVSDRFKTVEISIEQIDSRLTASISAMEHRITNLWSQVRDRQASAESKTDALTLAVETLGETLDLLRQRVEAVAEGTANLTGMMIERTEALSKDVLSRLEAVEKHLVRLSARVDGLSEDMRQRFRVVSERLGEIDRRLAA